MKRRILKITLAFVLAVCSLSSCGKDDSVHENSEKKNTVTTALTTEAVSSESTSTTVTASADKTEDVLTTQAQTETALPVQNEASQPDKTEVASVTSAEQIESKSDAITEDQALAAIKNYCFVKYPDLKNMVDSGEYNIYWNVTANNANEIVVLFRSYTGAQMHYYINTVSGETYVTEMVPGIIDEEQLTEESFNIKDYIA